MENKRNKDWTGNRKSTYITLGASNHTDKEREVRDFYATDPIAIDKLLSCPHVELPKKIWECACGEGHLSKRLEQLGYEVVSTDIEDRGYGSVLDFLEATEMPKDTSCILTNPPYKYAEDFVLHALELLPQGGLCIMFLKTTFLEGISRYKNIFRDTPPPEFMLQFSKRVLCAKNADFEGMHKGGGSAVAYCWMVWRKGFCGDTTIKWI